jgi:hypothetical protein
MALITVGFAVTNQTVMSAIAQIPPPTLTGLINLHGRYFKSCAIKVLFNAISTLNSGRNQAFKGDAIWLAPPLCSTQN